MTDWAEWRTLLLATAGVAALAVAGFASMSRLRAQAPAGQSATASADRPAFEVVSIKRNKSGSQGTYSRIQPGGLYTATNVTPRVFIAMAYLKGFPPETRLVFGGPAWIDSEHFDIEAKAGANIDREQERLMMQSLLADRFKLVVHHETRQLPVYALVLSKAGKIGPQLRPHSDDAKCTDAGAGQAPPTPAAGEVTPAYCGGFFMIPKPGDLREAGNKITMDLLASQLIQFLNQTVVDRTGLSGAFDFTLEFAPLIGPGSSPAEDGSVSDPSGPPALPTALQEQLGLKLESTTGPVDVLVIDHIEEPSEN